MQTIMTIRVERTDSVVREETIEIQRILTLLLWTYIYRLYHFPCLICSTGCSLNIVFFPRILKSLPPLPRQHSAAISCTKNYQPIGVTEHSHWVKSFEAMEGLQRIMKKHNFSWTPCTFLILFLFFLNTQYR